MSNLTQVLYGNRLYGNVTYEENFDPQTFAATLSDAQSSSDADVASAIKALSDAQSLAETIIVFASKVLSDTQSSTDAKVASLLKVLADAEGSSDAIILSTGKLLSDTLISADARIASLNKALSDSSSAVDSRVVIRIGKILLDALLVRDNTATVQSNKHLTDFFIIQEWVKIHLKKTNIWTSQSASEKPTASLTLFEPPLYAKELFSGGPSVLWEKPNVDSAAWHNAESINVDRPTLYAKTLFGRSLFSDSPTVHWGKADAKKENWTNEDGQNNQEV